MKKALSAISLTLFALTIFPLFAQGANVATTSPLKPEKVQAVASPGDHSTPPTISGAVSENQSPVRKDVTKAQPSQAATKTITIEPEQCVTRCYYVFGVPVLCYEVCY